MPNAHPGQILKLPTESFASALRDLDPASRALLDLSLRRGLRPEEIADMLGADENAVVSSRDHALDQLASDLGAPIDQLDELRVRLAELPPEDWTGLPVDPSNGVASGAPAAAPVAAREAPRGRALVVVLLLLAVAGIVVAIAIGPGGTSTKPSSSAPAAARTRTAPAPTAPAATARVTAVGAVGAGVKGTAAVSDGTLTLELTGLPAPRPGGSYEAWLFNSVIDAKPLGSARATPVRITAKLPPDASRYSFVDVSYQPNAASPNHSGESVARVPLAELLKRH